MTDDGAGLISKWDDLVAALSLTGATTARPTWSATSFNSAYAGVTGDGVANVLGIESTGSLPATTAEGYMFLLAQWVATGNIEVAFCYGGAASLANRILRKSAGNLFQITDGTAVITSPAGSLTTGFHLYHSHLASGGLLWDGTRDGINIPSATATTASTVATRTRLFANIAATPLQFASVTIRYAAVCGAMTTLQIQQLEGWMCHTSGVNRYCLPSTHPFRNRKP